jgi:ABC-2 type transport system permease protein
MKKNMVEDNIRSATTTNQERLMKGSTMQETVPQRDEGSREQEREFRAAPKMNTSPLHGLWALTNRDLKKWYKNPVLLFMSLIQPVVWLGLFGKALNFGSFISSPALLQSFFGTTSYFSFLACGMMAFVILFTAAFGGMSVVWDRRFGFMNKALSTPVARGSVAMAKVLQSVFRALITATIVLGVAIALGMLTSGFTVQGLLGAYAVMFLLAFGLSSLFVMLAIRSSDWQTQMAIINLLNLPLLFASNALFPVKIMPTWLQYVAKLNPVSYANDAIRQLLLGASAGQNPLALDFGVLGIFAAILAGVSIYLSWKLLSK